MRRLRGCLVVAFIFGCGFLVGGFLGAAFGWVGFFHKVVKGGPDSVREIVVERATSDLGLKAGQQREVRKIVDETGAELVEATVGVRPRIEEIFGRAEQRLRAVLTTDQRKKFDPFAEQGRRRWKAPETPAAPAPPAEPEQPAPSNPSQQEQPAPTLQPQ